MSGYRLFSVKFFAARISDGNRASESLILYGMKILQLSAVFILPEIGFCFFFQKILITFGTILTGFPGRTSGKTKILKKKLKITDWNQIINGLFFSVSNRNELLEIFPNL